MTEEEFNSIIENKHINFFKDKKVLITGASGLVGGYFSQFFQYLDIQNLGNFSLTLNSKSGEFPFKLNPKTVVKVGDLNSHATLDSLPLFDVIIHAAGYAQPGKFLSDPRSTILLNSFGTISLIDKLDKGGTFLFISSSEVYSGLPNPPYSENQIGTTNTNHPRSSYIEGKRVGESIVSSTKIFRNDIKAKSVRLSLAYGPGTKRNDARVLHNFIDEALISGEIRMRDAGQAWRTYCYILDSIEMCLCVLIDGEEELYNVGGISRVQILGLAKTVAMITGARLSVPKSGGQFLEGAPNDVSLNLDKILRLSKKSNFIPMEVGIERTIEWHKAHLP